MGTAERRLEILKYLCKKRHATMPELAQRFGVSVRTIQRDIGEIEISFRVPLEIKCGMPDGGVYIIGDYSFDRAYMRTDEIALLEKLKAEVGETLSHEELRLLSVIIETYKKPSFFSASRTVAV